MKIVTISGSSRPGSTNVALLKALSSRYTDIEFIFFDISILPLFIDQGDAIDYPDIVNEWRRTLVDSDALIISTPEYIFNLPAALKNALEWITQSGELLDKKVLPITYLPSRPRGAKAMQSLLWSIQALSSNVVGQLDLYQTDITIDEGQITGSEVTLEMLDEGIQLLINGI